MYKIHIMNRLILIGNGFDKAHGLKTSYKEFIEWYFDKFFSDLSNCKDREFHNPLSQYKIVTEYRDWQNFIANDSILSAKESSLDKLKAIRIDKSHFKVVDGFLISRIIERSTIDNWVDIEEIYYELLKSILKGNLPLDYYQYNKRPVMLNIELECLKNYLIQYLLEINTSGSIFNKSINEIFYGPIYVDDIAVSKKVEFTRHILENFHLSRGIIANMNKRYYRSGVGVECQMLELEDFKKMHYDESEIINTILTESNILESLSFPNNVLVLSFNYTNTEKVYTEDMFNVKVVHIHGELCQPDSVIFGYGDELDEEYKILQKANTNEYLKNIKSIRYLESGRYREMLEFINSAPFQIYILGHSCGGSDRTLLNTLFEHPNCVSIKPYYFQKSINNDNYLDIVENMSKSFMNMKLMRDIVVNKLRCSPIPQAQAAKCLQ